VHEQVAKFRREGRDEGLGGRCVVDADDLAEHGLELLAVRDDRRAQRARVFAQGGRNGGCIEQQMQATLAQQEDALAHHRPSLRDGLVVQ